MQIRTTVMKAVAYYGDICNNGDFKELNNHSKKNCKNGFCTLVKIRGEEIDIEVMNESFLM